MLHRFKNTPEILGQRVKCQSRTDTDGVRCVFCVAALVDGFDHDYGLCCLHT